MLCCVLCPAGLGVQRDALVSLRACEAACVTQKSLAWMFPSLPGAVSSLFLPLLSQGGISVSTPGDQVFSSSPEADRAAKPSVSQLSAFLWP